MIILVPRPTSFSFDNCISTILFPFTRPSFIITEVDIIFSTIFCAVPAFILVLPVTNSGPVITSIGYSEANANGLFELQVIQPVIIALFLACLIPPITYGVVPEAAIPTKTSFSVISYS